MTGTAHPAPDPPPAHGTRTHPVRALTRSQARDAALSAALTWYDTVERDLTALLEAAGVHGERRVVVFTSSTDHTPDGDAIDPCHWADSLRSVQLVGLTNEVTLTAGPGPDADLWADAVNLWLDLLDCLAVLSSEQTAPSLLVDLDTRTVGTWETYYCPDEGTDPETTQVIRTHQQLTEDQDPFAALLADDHDDMEDPALDNILHVMDLHALDVPSTPGHEPGGCTGA